MATTPGTAPPRHPSADAIRDVCARPAALLLLDRAIPAAAAPTGEARRRAIADGVARALELAGALARGEAADRRDHVLLEEADRRLWGPVDRELARVLARTGPDGLHAYLVVEGAVRREAWRADQARRRAPRHEPLSADVAADPGRDPVDLVRFRRDVERAARVTRERTGLPDEIAVGLVAREIGYAEAARRTGRSPNALWMAISRLRPEWRGVAERGREAGLGGGVLVGTAERTDGLVRRAVRWRLVGGLTAVVLLALAAGALTTAALIERTTPPARAEAPEPVPSAPSETSPLSQAGRLAALEAARRLAAAAPAPRPERPDPPASPARPDAASAEAPGAAAGAAGAASGAEPATAPSCGLGSAEIGCR
ncbi:MAG: YjbH domain-containing protein [Actinobacteria bacterium]|nr:YjbH domain-containing protein [Actinomycetota bacterium]